MENTCAVYNLEDIQIILGISRSTAYKFIKEVYDKKDSFKVIKIGSTYRVPKEPFDKWLLTNT